MTSLSNPTRLLLALSAIKGVGPAALKRVAAIPAFSELGLAEWSAAVPQIAKATEDQSHDVLWSDAVQWADQQVAAAEKNGARILSAVDPEYPKLLAATKDDPFLLFVKGRLAAADQHSVAIIGTREPTAHGVTIAKRITQFFVEQRWSVVSGLALGCDSVAHQAAIDAGGHTVAVLAHGLQMIAPSRHKQLAQDILDAGGALVSEYPFGRGVVGAQFVKRDRTQAGMAQGVVMVQSDVKGGSLHASRAALDYQRWLAVPYPTDKDRESGEPKVQANLVIADGADAERANLLRCSMSALRWVKVVRGREDYLRLIGEESSEATEPLPPPVDDQGRTASSEQPQNSLVDLVDADSAPDEATTEQPAVPIAQPEVIPSAEVSDAAGADDKHAILVLAPSLYHLEVRPEDLAILKTTRLPLAEAGVVNNADRRPDIDTDVVVIVRLTHLQAKLDDLRKAHPAKRPIEGRRAMLLQFQVEDLLTQMKLAADQLMGLDHGVHRDVLKTILVKRGATAAQPELPLGGEPAGAHDAPLVEVLDFLVGALPRSVSVSRPKAAHGVVDPASSVEVHLGDLVASFNSLVQAALPGGSYRMTTSVDGQT